MPPTSYVTHSYFQSNPNLFSEVNEKVLPHLLSTLRTWLPQGKVVRDEYIALNPTRVDRHLGSFRINFQTGQWIDFATNDKGGDCINLYAYLKGLSQKEAAHELFKQFNFNAIETFPQASLKPSKSPKAPSELIDYLWQSSVAAEGTLVEKYLCSRCYTDPIPPTLRYLPHALHTPSQTRLPCMVGAIMKWPWNITGLHRTYLKSDGSGKADVYPNKMMLGQAKEGGIFLTPVKEELFIAEGIETALSIILPEFPSVGVWAALSASGMMNLKLPPLPLAQKIVIAADPDLPGIRAAQQAGQKWSAEGRYASFVFPPDGQDFNDILREF